LEDKKLKKMQKIKDLDKLLNSSNIRESIVDVDDFVWKVCEYGKNFDVLTEPQKNFSFCKWFEQEVNNGGFWQYFINSSGNVAHQTVDSLRAIGANETADMLQKAIDQFPKKTVPNTYDEKVDVLYKIGKSAIDVWNELDKTFYEYPPDDLDTLNFEYIKQNRDAF